MLLLKMTSILFFAVSFLLSVQAQEYVPGTPGGPWTEEELITVKSKLYAIFGNGGYEALKQLYGGVNPGANWMDVPNAPKMLRLGFHDCLKYTDGTGGCDGCLNWEGVGFRFTDSPNTFKYENVGETNNNGLRYTVEVLEGIYTDANYPAALAPTLNVSLKASGKSRADLWAYAAIVAVEFGIETNNMVCDGTFNSNPNKQCNIRAGTPECLVTPSRSIKFETGRADCTEFGDQPYKATKTEVHPISVGNGKMTADFFQDNFGFNGRETVAIMGAHTMGRLHVAISLFRYLWTTREQTSFNNGYYKNIVREKKYSWFDDKCTLFGDAEGNVPETRWMVHVRKDTKNGGPVHWIHENYQCPDCSATENGCCVSGICQADSDSILDDNDINGGCEKYRFISGLDEMALPCEIGLYFDFEVTEDGIPYGCPGLERFTPERFNQSHAYTWSALPKPGTNNWKKSDPMCEPNALEYPSGSTPLHQIFEEFAADQNAWVEQFIPTFEKMLRNGYSDLHLSPHGNAEVSCNRVGKHGSLRYTNCRAFEDANDFQTFRIISRRDGRAIEYKSDVNKCKMMIVDKQNANQEWFFSNYGNQLINVGTGKPLRVDSSGRAWQYDEDSLIFNEPRVPNKVLSRNWNNQDGSTVNLWDLDTKNNQRWILTPSELPLVSDQFKIVSLLDNRVMQGKPNGEARMMTSANNRLSQLWFKVDMENGAKYINVKTGLPLFASWGGSTYINTWLLDEQQRFIEVGGEGKALDRGWNQANGVSVGTWEAHGGVNQKFMLEAVDVAA